MIAIRNLDRIVFYTFSHLKRPLFRYYNKIEMVFYFTSLYKLLHSLYNELHQNYTFFKMRYFTSQK